MVQHFEDSFVQSWFRMKFKLLNTMAGMDLGIAPVMKLMFEAVEVISLLEGGVSIS